MIELEQLQIHNDVRLHPQRPAMRVFRRDAGYRATWYPPHVFCIECNYMHDQEERMAQRWFASTNVESWIVAGDQVALKSEIPKLMAAAETTAKMQVSGLIEISKTCQAILARLQAGDKPASSQAKAK